MIAPIGDELSPPTHAVRRPSRESAYDTLYSPPPTHTSSIGANSIRPCCGGERRIMHSPRETRSKRQSFSFRILSMSLSCSCCMQQSSDSDCHGKRRIELLSFLRILRYNEECEQSDA